MAFEWIYSLEVLERRMPKYRSAAHYEIDTEYGHDKLGIAKDYIW